MAFLDRSDQLTLVDRLNVLPLVADAFPILVLGGFPVVDGEVRYDVLVSFKGAEFLIVTVEEPARGTCDHTDILGTELRGVAVSPSLLYCLIELCVTDFLSLAFDHPEGPLA